MTFAFKRYYCIVSRSLVSLARAVSLYCVISLLRHLSFSRSLSIYILARSLFIVALCRSLLALALALDLSVTPSDTTFRLYFVSTIPSLPFSLSISLYSISFSRIALYLSDCLFLANSSKVLFLIKRLPLTHFSRRFLLGLRVELTSWRGAARSAYCRPANRPADGRSTSFVFPSFFHCIGVLSLLRYFDSAAIFPAMFRFQI